MTASPPVPSRAAIAAACRRAEADCVAPLLEAARLPPRLAAPVRALALDLAARLRARRMGAGGVDALMEEFSLDSQEGVALMCLAEALARIPDRQTRDSLIRDKIGHGDWRAHLGHSPSPFVNAAAWGLLLTGALASTADETGLAGALGRALARGGEPLVRAAVDLALRLLGEQFILAPDIGTALKRAARRRAAGYRHSYDMLGEAAVSAADAARYQAAYRDAIVRVGAANGGRGVVDGDGVSVKLSALHPHYGYRQRRRVLDELGPRLLELARLARDLDLGLSIDAEEADRLELSLDLLEMLLADPGLAGWQGLGFVVQAYQKRALAVCDYLLDRARARGRRLMLRLVKGAYWDAEVKRAQVDGLDDYPVFTRKCHTDLSYLACARLLLARRDVVLPQFATHNAHTVAAVHHLAGPWDAAAPWEFQCLHGMGEDLYDALLGPAGLDRPCRIYAPVGGHAALLAYLVRRLLENGANSSFVKRVVDSATPLEALVADPVEAAGRSPGPNPRIPLPEELFGDRRNARGVDLSDQATRDTLEAALAAGSGDAVEARPLAPGTTGGAARAVANPARPGQVVGWVRDASDADLDAALETAADAQRDWSAVDAAERAGILDRAGDAIESAGAELLPLLVAEAGKTLPAALAELREATDFCRYYAARLRADPGLAGGTPLGPLACISPWNFPLAIFVGQAAAALGAGNVVLAKPAEETPLVAFRATRLLHRAGVPEAALQFLPGPGETVGARLVADPRVAGVLFTGSTPVAREINRALAHRPGTVLVAETGGVNAMIVDSSALPEQVVADALASAFDSAGQRCSALRLLCVQEDIADALLEQLLGAMAELRAGDPAQLSSDLGPLISGAARQAVEEHLARCHARGWRVHQAALPASRAEGHFLAPALVEIPAPADLPGEVFGPVLHFTRFRRDGLAALVADINRLGHGLTMGVQTRIDETVALVRRLARVGNLYVNRNMIGAVVGVQPFGGEGLSGTGPKAGGPLMLHRLRRGGPAPLLAGPRDAAAGGPARHYATWLAARAPSLGLDGALVDAVAAAVEGSPLGLRLVLPGPVGEDNELDFHPRGPVAGVAASLAALALQLGLALASGNRLLTPRGGAARALADALPEELAGSLVVGDDWAAADLGAVLDDGSGGSALAHRVAARPGRLVPVIPLGGGCHPAWLLCERAVSVNSAAAGGNARLMALED